MSIANTSDARTQNAARVKELEQRLPIGPATAQSLGLRIAWRLRTDAASVTGMFASNGGVFLVDSLNEVTMFDIVDGAQRWRAFGGGGSDLIIDVVHLPEDELVLVVRTNSILTLSSRTGLPVLNQATQSSVQPLEWLAQTPGIVYGEAYIYGGLGGEVVWQGWRLGFSTHAHRLGRRFKSPPIVAEGTVLASSQDGTLAAFHAGDSSLKWKTKLLDSMAGVPATGGDTAFIAGGDQHLRAMALTDGKVKWARLFDAPLQRGPKLIGDTVYQQVPGAGLVAMQAAPANAPEGVIDWTASGVHGDVLGLYGDLLLVWDEHAGTLRTMSPSTGTTDTQAALSSIAFLRTAGDHLIVLGKNELECLESALGH